MNKTREELLNEINTLKQALEKAEKSKKAVSTSNQQLQATEQQIRAANQQLEATEQQLRAANQQLKAAEEQAQAAKEKFKKLSLLRNAILESPQKIIVFALDKQYCYLDFTVSHKQTMKEIWGVNIERGDNMLDFIKNRKDRQKAKANFDQALEGSHFVLQEEYGDKNLKRTFYENHYNPVIDKNNNEIIGVSVYVVDITHQKETEYILNNQLLEHAKLSKKYRLQNEELDALNQQLQATEQQLRATNQQLETNIRALTISSERYKALIAVSNTGAWEYHLDTDFLWCSPEYFSMLGRDINDYNFSGTANLKETWLSLLHPADRENAGNHFSNYLKNSSPGMYENIFRLRHSDGHWVWILSRGNTIRDKNGKVTNLTVGTHIDISDRKKAEETLKAALEKAQESDRLKSAFLANMSHEIRTPMNGILGFTNLLNNPEINPAERQQFTTIINQSGKRLLNTINDLIDISKIEAGQMKVSKAETAINHLLDELLNFFKPEANAKGLTLNMLPALPNEKSHVFTDGAKLHGILTNLIKNAIKYTDSGSITFGYSLKSNFLEFFVKDTGSGIPKNRQKAVFNRFEQADIKDTKAMEGSGLGLAIAKAYVEMLGGKIWLISKEGVGAKFMFTLPYPTNEKQNARVSQKEQKNFPDVLKERNLELLIVEDEDTSALFLTTILKGRFGKIHYAKTGKEAIEICKDNPETDIILMDLKMPEMDGYEATRSIRKFNKKVHIIAQTAYALTGDSEKAIAAGCNDYITKPIDKVKLIKLINQYIEKKSDI